MTHRRKVDMLCGFSGSASPSNATKYGSGVTTPALALFGRWLLSSPSWCQVNPSAPALEWCDSILFRLLPSCDPLPRLRDRLHGTISSSFEARCSFPSRPITFSSSPLTCVSWCVSLLFESLIPHPSRVELSLLLVDRFIGTNKFSSNCRKKQLLVSKQ